MADNPPADNAPKKNRWLIPALIVVLAVIGAGGFFAWRFMGGAAPKAPPPPAPPIFMALDPFTVNLQPGGPQRHLHVGITVRVGDAASQAQLTQFLPEVRSRVLTVLSNREGPALMEPAARDALAEELEQSLKRPFVPQQPAAQVAGVMFTTFLLQ